MRVKPERVLVVEDEPIVALDLQRTLEDMGHLVCSVRNSFASAIEAIEQHHPTLVLMDIRLQGDGDGIHACEQIYRRWGLPVIFLTAFADATTIARAAACKPFGYLMKPFFVQELDAVMQVARSRHDAELSLVRSQRRLALVADAAELGIWEWEAGLAQIRGDARFDALLGGPISPCFTSLKALLRCVHDDDRAVVAAQLVGMGYFECTFRALRTSGDYVWLDLFGNRRREGNADVVVGAIRDVSARMAADARLRQAQIVFDTIAEGVLILDAQGKLVSLNPAFTRLCGYREDELRGRAPADFLYPAGVPVPDFALLGGAADAPASETVCHDRQGRQFNVLQQICCVRDARGRTMHFVQTVSDLSVIQASAHQLAHLAYHDPLTRLPNRRLLMDRLAQAIASCHRHAQTGALLFIDLDNFKTLNDTLGHVTGDCLLEQVATRLVGCVREVDTVARIGGDEFMVLLCELGPQRARAAERAEVVGRHIVATLSGIYQLDSASYHGTASIGATVFDSTPTPLDDLFKQADIAMYQSKKDGRNRLSFFDPAMQVAVDQRAALETQLRTAIEERQFSLYYQVQVGLDYQPVGAEALLRWDCPQRGLVAPAQFIPMAEETGLIIAIGQWVLETACAQLQAWQASPATARLVLAVNVSAKQLRQHDFVQMVQALLLRYSVEPALLKLEITESMLIDDSEATIAVMGALRRMGIAFSLDDFGTGYSSLQYLKRLPLAQIKIDQSFVHDLVEEQNDRTLVRTIITMAISLDLDTIAEGVETLAQLQLLRRKGCRHFQGYLLGRPQPIAQFNARLAQPWGDPNAI